MPKLDKCQLEEITIEQYRIRQEWWGGGLKLDRSNLYCRVINPFCFDIDDSNDDARIDSYHSAILKLLEFEIVCYVSVNKQRVWRRVQKFKSSYKVYDKGSECKLKDISGIGSDPEIREMAKIAANDPKHYNYMEIMLGHEGDTRNRPYIQFVEYKVPEGNKIFSLEVMFHYEFRGFFTIRSTNKRYYWCHGLWAPKNYIELLSPASMRRK